jgi:hypothetical protein
VNKTFTVGANTAADWPMAQWKDASLNSIMRISFTISAAQANTPLSLRIDLTRAAAGGRPIISVDGGNYSNAPSPSSQPGTRGITLGSWRGNNWMYTYNVSSGGLSAGTHTIDIQIASGSSSTSPYLQPSVTYDSIELVKTSALTSAPVVSSITLTPANPSIGTNAQQAFVATARDQFGNVTPANVNWSTTRGVIDGAGNYTAPSTSGAATVTAISGSISGSTNVTVVALQATSATWDYVTAQRLTYVFNRNVTLSTSGLTLQNLTTGSSVAPAEFVLNNTDGTATFTFAHLLADGYYRATLAAGAVQDANGSHLENDIVIDFFVLGGDANHDAVVDSADLGILSNNWNTTGKNFSQADFNYDGRVDVADFKIFAGNWNKSLGAAPSRATPISDPVAVVSPEPAPSSSAKRTRKSDKK